MTLFAIFLEGLLSFISPCVLPLIPLYMSYLSKGAKEVNAEGEVTYRKSKVFLMTFFFVLGISTTFFILGLSLSFVKDYIQNYAEIIGLLGGAVLIVFGLHELEIILIKPFMKAHKFETNVSKGSMNILKSYFIGFLFSFGWSPCIGPLLGNVLIMAASESVLVGNLYLLVYALGFVIPFLILGLFTKVGLELLKKHRKIFDHAMKIAGIIIILFGVTMIYDHGQEILQLKKSQQSSYTSDPNHMVFKDHLGNDIALSDYEGEFLFVQYITTWCTYCAEGIPEYQSFLEDNDLKGIYVMSPTINNGDLEEIQQFAQDKNINIPILVDETGFLFYYFGIDGYPTLTVLGPGGEYIGYVAGALSQEYLDEIYKEALKRYENR